MSNSLKKYLHELDKLQQLIFSFYIKRNYGENRFLHEKNLLKQTTRVMHTMTALRKKVTDEKLILHLEQIYEIIFALDLLKNRLIDHTTFEICEQELKMITHCLSSCIQELITHKKITAKEKLDTAIRALQINFENTIQVVAADPMVFLFFIKDLYALNNRLDSVALIL